MYNDFKELLSALNAHRVRYLILSGSKLEAERNGWSCDGSKLKNPRVPLRSGPESTTI
jgi:hypothetical protein